MRSSDLGERLYAARNAAGLSQRALASRAGVAPSTVSLLESKAWTATVETAEKLADGLGVDPRWLAYGKKPAEVPQGTIAERLRAKRAELGLSTYKLAEQAGITQAVVTFIENHPEKANPTLTTLLGLARALSVSPAWLSFGIGEP